MDKTGQAKTEDEISTTKWRWIGHTLRKQQDIITRQALSLNPQSTRRK
jgi:hypothetical protein